MTEPKPQVITKSPDYREGYADTVGISCNLWDFVLTFGVADYAEGEPAPIENFQRIRISAQVAKAMLPMLEHTLRIYEGKFGEIPKPPDPATGSPVVN